MPTLSRAGWRNVPDDPDPYEDLGYDCIDLDIIQTSNTGRSQVLVLPSDEDLLRENAFLVVDEDSLCELETMV